MASNYAEMDVLSSGSDSERECADEVLQLPKLYDTYPRTEQLECM